MIEAGFDTQKTGVFLDSIINKQDQAQQTPSLTNRQETDIFIAVIP